MAGGPRGLGASTTVVGGAVGGGRMTAGGTTMTCGVGRTGTAAIAKAAPDSDTQSGQTGQSDGL
jgi:hypothetical protein